MARIRTIKPEFFTSEDVCSLPPLARLLYIALWCEADREGRLLWKPLTFKLRYFPADDVNIAECARALVDCGLVKLYGEGYAVIPTFAVHQHINPREAASTLPAPDAHLLVTDRKARVQHASPRVNDASARDSDAQGGREGKGKEGEKKTSADADVVPGEQPPVTNVRQLPAVPVCPHEDIIAEYHRVLPELPQVRIWDERRQSLLRSRWREATDRQTLAWWTGFFEYVRRCPFLLGQAEGRRDPFLADLEWLIRPQNFAKVIEGRYQRAEGQA